MIITVITMRMMQVTIDKIIDMVAVRNGFVPTTGAVHVTFLVSAAFVAGRAAIGICVGDFDAMLDDLAILGDVMQVPVVQVVDVITVLDPGVLTIRSVLVVMILVYV